MPNIRPSSTIRNNYNEISEFCHKYDEPIFITKNGMGDLAVFSIEAYEKLVGKFELYKLINEGIDAIKNGNYRSANSIFEEIEERGSIEKISS